MEKIAKLDKTKCIPNSTKPQNIEKDKLKSLAALTHHSISCPDNHIITQFTMRSKKSPDQVFYNYTCCPAQNMNCKTVSTAEAPVKTSSVTDLLNYQVGGEKGIYKEYRGIQQFKLEMTKDKKSFSYELTTCDVVG